MINRRSSFFFALCLMAPTWAQETGTIRMLIDPGHNFSFIVDQKQRLQQREVKLTEGLHKLTIWAPERQIVDTNVFVIADRTTDLVLGLPYSSEFIAYKGELGKYQTKKRWVRTMPVLVMTGGLVWTGIALGKYGKAKDALEKDEEDYQVSVDPATIRTLKSSTIPAHNEDMKKARTNLYTGMAITAIGAGATYFIFRRTAKWDRPLFDDKEKVRFDGMAWVPDAQGGSFMAGLTIQLVRP